MLHVGLLKPNPFCRQPVDMGRLRQRMPIAPYDIGSHFIRIDVDYIHGEIYESANPRSRTGYP
jgi:hypothetical protein